MVVGLTCTNQTAGVIEVNDGVTGTIVGASITRNSGTTTNPVIKISSPFTLLDTKMALTGTAANTLGIDNSGCGTDCVTSMHAISTSPARPI